MKRRNSRGFTIMELLLAVAVAGMLMVAAVFQIVSLTSIWANRTQVDSFAEHADGVARFLNRTIEDALKAGPPEFKPTDLGNGQANGENPDGEEGEEGEEGENGGGSQSDYDAEYAGTAGGANGANGGGGVTFDRPPGYGSAREPLIHFRLKQPPPVLNETQLRGLPTAEVYLLFDDREGLALLWYLPLTEDKSDLDSDSVRSILLSPYITEIAYIYRDDDDRDWEVRDDLIRRGGDYTMPDFLRLTFELEDQRLTRLVRIPKKAGTMPLF